MPRGVYERTAKMNAARKGIPKPPRTPEHCAAMSEAKKGVPQTPEHSYAITKGLIGHSVSDKTRVAISKAKKGVPKSSVAAKDADDRQRGGDDIVWHHTLYDHVDLSKNRVPMTRRNHTMGHNILRKLGIKIPHINVKEVI